MCECFQIGGRFIAEDPDCPVHGTMACAEREEAEAEHRRMEQEIASLTAEVAAWRRRFLDFEYRRAEDLVDHRPIKDL